MLDEKALAELEAAEAAATPGPWVARQPGDDDSWWWVWRESVLPNYGGVAHCQITDGNDPSQEKADADLIALLRNHARDLIAAAKRPKAKRLEWDPMVGCPSLDRCRTHVGEYLIEPPCRIGGPWYASLYGKTVGLGVGPDDAKAAAQAHFDKIVAECLE